MNIKLKDKVKIIGSKTGRILEVFDIQGCRVILRPYGSDAKGGFAESISNLRKVKRG